MQKKYKATNPEQAIRDKRFKLFEKMLGLTPTKLYPKHICTKCMDHVYFYKHHGAQLQFDSPYYKRELPEDYYSIWLPLEVDPYQGGIAVGTGPTYPRISCHKSSNANLDWLEKIALEWAESGNCYQEVT